MREKKELLGADERPQRAQEPAPVVSDAASHVAHTPGPWEVAPHSDTDELVNVVAGYREIVKDGRTIKQAHWIAELDASIDFDSDVDAELAEMNANARLIAAAPDYHDKAHALAMAVLQSDLYRDDLDVRALVQDVLAIHAKAEGR